MSGFCHSSGSTEFLLFSGTSLLIINTNSIFEFQLGKFWTTVEFFSLCNLMRITTSPKTMR